MPICTIHFYTYVGYVLIHTCSPRFGAFGGRMLLRPYTGT